MTNSFFYRPKTKTRSKSVKILSLLTLGLLIIGLGATEIVKADQFDAQINSLRAENNSLQTERRSLQNEANTLEATINGLAAQIAELERQIATNQAKKQALEAEMAKTEVKLTKQRKLLAENIRAMYLKDQISTIEMLASSNDLSDFVDREQYRLIVKDKISAVMDEINRLLATLNSQKAEVDKLIADQRGMQGQLDAQRAEQSRLLALNQQERTALDTEIRANSAKIGELRSQQVITNSHLFGSGLRSVPDPTGYPWANVQPFPNTYADPWGMYKRQCVSYTAWRVAQSGRHMPYWGGRGNANLWDDNARAAGIPVDRSPRVGDVAVSNSGYYGHVMYVEAVFGDGTIYVSQYNASWTGKYSEARIPIGALLFIHF